MTGGQGGARINSNSSNRSGSSAGTPEVRQIKTAVMIDEITNRDIKFIDGDMLGISEGQHGGINSTFWLEGHDEVESYLEWSNHL